VNDDLASEARIQVRRALREMAMHPGIMDEPDPLEALAALQQLRGALAHAERDAARRARESGKSWAQIGDATVPDPAGSLYPAAEAFGRVASDIGNGPSFPWTCPSCGNLVTDYGPYSGPHDGERGHSIGCERFAATVQAWDAQWREGGEDG